MKYLESSVLNSIRIFVFILSFLLSDIGMSQTASGTITFRTNDAKEHEITMRASDLVFNPGAYRYYTGVTNQPIEFSNWRVDNSTLGITDLNPNQENLVVYGNPNGSLLAEIKTNGFQNISVGVYDSNGKIVSIPKTKIINDKFIIEDRLTNVNPGLYYVKVNGDLNLSFRFIKSYDFIDKMDSNEETFKSLINNIKTDLDHSNNKNEISKKDANYRIIWNSNNVVDNYTHINIVEGDNNNISIDVDIAYVGEQTGDVFIFPQLNGSPKDSTIISLTNTIFPDSTYLVSEPLEGGIFWNVYVANENNPTKYKVEISDQNSNSTFLPTTKYIDIYQDNLGEINRTKTLNLDPVPNEHEIRMVIRDQENLNVIPNFNVEILEATVHPRFNSSGDIIGYNLSDFPSDRVIESKITDDNGMVIFSKIAGGQNVYFKVFKDGYYKKTNDFYRVPVVNRQNQQDTLLNMTAVKKLFYPDGDYVSSDTLMRYYTRSVNSEFLLGHMSLYIPPGTNGRQNYIDHITELAVVLGFPGSFKFPTEPFPSGDSPPVPRNYNPFPNGRNVLSGQVGYNMYDGSSQASTGTIFVNSIAIQYHGVINGLSTLAIVDHEIGHALGFMNIAWQGNLSAMNLGGGMNKVTVSESKYDSTIMPLWLNLGKRWLVSSDSKGRFIDYSYTIRLEDYDPINENLDDDSDNIINKYDSCPGTPLSEAVDENGCSESQLDDDNDGISNLNDICPETPFGTDVDENGCSE